VDCAWKCEDGRWHCFEVVVEADNLSSHLQHCLSVPTIITDITVVAGEMKTLNELRAALEADAAVAPFLSRVQFTGVGDFLPALES